MEQMGKIDFIKINFTKTYEILNKIVTREEYPHIAEELERIDYIFKPSSDDDEPIDEKSIHEAFVTIYNLHTLCLESNLGFKDVDHFCKICKEESKDNKATRDAKIKLKKLFINYYGSKGHWCMPNVEQEVGRVIYNLSYGNEKNKEDAHRTVNNILLLSNGESENLREINDEIDTYRRGCILLNKEKDRLSRYNINEKNYFDTQIVDLVNLNTTLKEKVEFLETTEIVSDNENEKKAKYIVRDLYIEHFKDRTNDSCNKLLHTALDLLEDKKYNEIIEAVQLGFFMSRIDKAKADSQKYNQGVDKTKKVPEPGID